MLKKIFNSSIFNSWFNAVVGMFSSLIAIPIVVTKLSVSEINIWFLLTSIVILSQSVLFGFGTTFSRFITYAHSGVKIIEFRNLRLKKNVDYMVDIDKEELGRIFFLMEKVYIYIALIYFFLICAVVFLTLSKPIKSLTIQSDGWLVGVIVIVSTTVMLVLGFYQTFLVGINNVALTQRIMGVVKFIGLFFILGVLFWHPTLVSIVCVYQLVDIITILFIMYFARKKFIKMNIPKRVNFFDKELFSIVWDSAWKSGFTTIVSNAVKHASSLLIAQLLSPAASASFLFTKRMFDIIERFTMVTFSARLPMIARYRGQGRFDSLLPYLKQTQYISYSIFIIGYVSLLIADKYILALLGTNVNLGSMSLIMLFSFATFMTRWGAMALSVSSQSNHVVEHINAIIVGIVFFSVIYLMYDKIGVDSFPFALLVSMMVVAPVIIKLVYGTLHTTFFKYEKKVFFPMLGILILINTIYFWVSI